MNNVVPGILEQEWEEIEKKLEIVKPFAKEVHIDLIDGKFVNNTTFLSPEPFKKYSSTFLLELHMMVENPIQYLEPFAKAGFKRFLGHIEKMPDQKEFVGRAKSFGETGLAIDGPTNLGDVTVPFADLDAILVMGYNAGYSGQKFTSECMDKVRKIREQNSTIAIEVDGGINDGTIIIARESGATRFVTTSFLFSSRDPQYTFKALQTLTEQV